MAVFRVEKTKDFTLMSNHHLKNRKLTLKAKGLLSLMLSLPDSWDYTLKGLASICSEGIDAVRTAVKELEQEGYIDSTAERTIQTDLPGEALVYTYSKSTKQGPKEHLPFVKSCKIGEGTLILCSLELEGRTGVNPELDRLLGKLLGF